MAAGLPPGYRVDPPIGGDESSSPKVRDLVKKGYTVGPPLGAGATAESVENFPGMDWLKSSFSTSNLANVAGQTGAQVGAESATAAALAALGLAPETGGLSFIPPIAGAVASGLYGMKNRAPGESRRSSFLWNGIPALLGGGGSTFLKNRLTSKMGQAVEEDAAKFAKGVTEEAGKQHTLVKEAIAGGPATQAEVNRAARAIGAPRAIAPAPLEGEARTAATNEATDAVMGPINRMRSKLGEPIGEAYKNLKNPEQEITPAEAQQLSEGARAIRDSSLSPSPKAVGIIRRLQRFGVTEGGDKPGAIRTIENMFGGENSVGRGANRAVAPKALSSFTPTQMAELDKITAEGRAPTKEDYERIASMGAEVKTATYDDLREVRQHIGDRLKTATGGDAHNLRALQQQIDNILVDKLPDNMGALRNSYRGFIKNYPWQDINQLRAAGTPEDVGQWLFTRSPSTQLEIIHNATPQERGAMADLFRQRALAKVNPEAPAPEQMSAITKAVGDPLRSGVPRALGMYQKELSNLIHEPGNRALVARNLASARGQREWNAVALNTAMKLKTSDARAFAAAYQNWFDKLPPELQTVAAKYATPIKPDEILQLPTKGQSLATRIGGKSGSWYIPRFMIASTLGTAGTAALGQSMNYGGQWMVRATIGFFALTGAQAGWNVAMAMGGARTLATMVSNPAARFAAGATVRGLVNLGGQITKQSGEESNAAP